MHGSIGEFGHLPLIELDADQIRQAILNGI